MGNARDFADIQSGRDFNHEYKTIGKPVFLSTGEKAKVVQSKINLNSLPYYSVTSTYYVILDTNNKPKQMAKYDPTTHIRLKDFDWSHTHREFKQGHLHMQYFINGIREKDPRRPTEKEIRELKIVLKELGYDNPLKED